MPASRIFPKSCYSCLSPHLWEKISFMPILGEVCQVMKVWLCSLADPFIWNISTLQKFWKETNFSDYSRIHTNQDVSSPLWTSCSAPHLTPVLPGRQETAFQAVSEGQAGDGRFLHMFQGQRENVSEPMIPPNLRSPPLRPKRLSSPCFKTGTGKGVQGDSDGGGEKG